MDPSSLPPPLMDYFIRFVQIHETFRRPEIEALATLADVKVQWLHYSESSPYSTIRLSPLSAPSAAATLIHRSISSKAIYELWGTGTSYHTLHADIRRRSSHLWPLYKHASFKFTWDTFAGSRPLASQKPIINSFSYMGFEGPIRMKDPEEVFTIFEEYRYGSGTKAGEGKGDVEAVLERIYFGRLVAGSERSRGVLDRYSLKKRGYINTTSMDAELAFLMANLTLAAPGKVFYDPFVGTGGLILGCAHFGARGWGSDIDGRMVRGSGEGRDVRGNFGQYGLQGRYMDGFVADLTNSPIRATEGGRWLDGIVCDPPYGVREGLKVLGHRDGRDRMGGEVVWIEGVAAHEKEGYMPPKRAYSLEAMLGDILMFAARTLVDGERVSLWMPTANDAEEELAVPGHPALELLSVCVQGFNKWSRRLLTYRRIPGVEVGEEAGEGRKGERMTADELNGFRKRYFQGFRTKKQSDMSGGKAVPARRGKNEVQMPDAAGLELNEESLHQIPVIKSGAVVDKSLAE